MMYADKDADWLRRALAMEIGEPDAREGWDLESSGEWWSFADDYDLHVMQGDGVTWAVWSHATNGVIAGGPAPCLMEAADRAESALAGLRR